MYSLLKQFVPSKKCLSCDGCCRFREAQSCWRPRVTASEIASAGQPPARENVFSKKTLDEKSFVRTVAWKDAHLCYFFQANHNACGIYHSRPFDCRLYPFVLTMKDGQPWLSVHLSCPYIQEKRYSPEFDSYLAELKKFFSQKATARFLQEYLQVEPAYSGFEMELEALFPLSMETSA